MNLDLRLPIGLLFAIYGVILTGVGFFGPAALTERSLGVNINLWWGLVMLGFGVAMLIGSQIKK